MRFHLRWSGTVGRWIAPGPKTSGMPAAISARTIERMPAMPAPRLRLVGALEHHQRELALADLRGRDERKPVPGGTEHEIERARGRASASTSGAGSAPSSAEGKLSSSSGSPPSRAQTSKETVPGSMPATRGPRGQVSSSFAIS